MAREVDLQAISQGFGLFRQEHLIIGEDQRALVFFPADDGKTVAILLEG
jgi:hypothetical protein